MSAGRKHDLPTEGAQPADARATPARQGSGPPEPAGSHAVGVPHPAESSDATTPGPVLPLTDPRSSDRGVAGAKAANLARAAAAGLPVLPGFVLTTGRFDPAAPDWSRGAPPADVEAALRSAWTDLVGADEQVPLVVRSSSTIEDIGASSMAGQFRSCLDIRGWQRFLDAVRTVLASSLGPAAGDRPDPMAVLVQRQVQARTGGVLFGLDPVTGNRRRILVEVVPGGPEALVSGTVTAQRYLLTRRGRIAEAPADSPGLLDRRACRRLAGLAKRACTQFGCDQDIEWAMDAHDQLWLLQSRPVTAVGSAQAAGGPLLGPGPIGETFPDPLHPLEVDLWVDPLRDGIESALRVVGAVPSRAIADSPVVTTVAGRVACDLALLGSTREGRSAWRWLDPRVTMRRLASAWRIGRLRAVLPALATDMCRRIDTDLAEVGALAAYSDAELVEVLDRTRAHLRSAHGHEVLAGALLPDPAGATGAAVGMAVARRGRELGLSDDEITQRWPVALSLTAPRLGTPAPLPPIAESDVTRTGSATAAQVAALPAREALRLRARWLQELGARATTLLGQRLAEQRRIPAAGDLAALRLSEVEDLVSGWPAPDDLPDRPWQPGPPLPTSFRLAPDGQPIRVRQSGAHRPGGRGAAVGRAEGHVAHDPASARPGDILVTRTLDPRLAGRLPGLGGLVSETGSVLSHLAILAREYHVPTVVGVHDAVDRYPEGSRLLVDGTTGEVRLLADTGGDPG